MTFKEFTDSIQHSTPPTTVSIALKALWEDAKGDWDRAHDLAQMDKGIAGAWVHAYLHRKEGDQFNAGYWYRRAGKVFPTVSLAEEWKQMVMSLLT